MPKLTRNGEILFEHPLRSACIVQAFELGLVYDQHSRKRNRFLPGVKVEGVDFEQEPDKCITSLSYSE